MFSWTKQGGTMIPDNKCPFCNLPVEGEQAYQIPEGEFLEGYWVVPTHIACQIEFEQYIETLKLEDEEMEND